MNFLKNKVFKLFGISLLLLGVFFLLRQYVVTDERFYEITQESITRTPNYSQAVVSFGSTVVSVALADTLELRASGLSFTEPLKENTGMFFIFDTTDAHGFWMKDMRYPIDIIWFSEDMKVVHIEKSIAPETYPEILFPQQIARYVLEVPAGFSDIHSISVGDMGSYKQ